MFKVLRSQGQAVVWALILMLLVGAVSITRLEAQVDRATIFGTAMDTSGAVLVDANIQAKNLGTGMTYSAVTDSQGRYSIAELTVGAYELSATKAGFQKVVRTGITLTVGARPVVDFSLPVGQAEQVVEVQGQVSQVDTQTSTVASLVAPQQMQNLPLNGRNFSQLLTLAPGVQTVPAVKAGGGGSSTFYGTSDNFSVSGSRPVGQAFLLDNTDIRDFWQHGAGSSVAGTSLGMDAMQEFTVLTNTYSAEFGGAGAAVNAITKSGTNTLHGSAYEFHRNSVFDTKSLFDSHTGEIPSFKRNQFGGTLGGAIKKDKAFFFVNYEGLRQAKGITSQAFVPSARVHQGLIGSSTTPIAIDPIMKPILDRYNLPNAPCGTCTVDNGIFSSTSNLIVNENYSVRANRLHDRAERQPVRALGSGQGGPDHSVSRFGISLWPEQDKSINQYITLEERRTISMRLLNYCR